jgi:hypothetical protein
VKAMLVPNIGFLLIEELETREAGCFTRLIICADDVDEVPCHVLSFVRS